MKRRRRTEKADTFKQRYCFDPERRTNMERERIFVKGFSESQGEEGEKGKIPWRVKLLHAGFRRGSRRT